MELTDLGRETYVSITTFKRDGTAVSTPVWVAREDGRLLVWSAESSWKVKRIRRDGHVRLAACSARGVVRGEAIDATATIVEETATVERLLAAKYRLSYRAIRLFNAAVRFVRRRPAGRSVTIAISPPTV